MIRLTVYEILRDWEVWIFPYQYRSTWGLLTFESHFPKISQYLINGESDQKSALNKRDVELNFLIGSAFKFDISPAIIVLFQFQKQYPKTKKKSISRKRWFWRKKCIEEKRFKIRFYIRLDLWNFPYPNQSRSRWCLHIFESHFPKKLSISHKWWVWSKKYSK